MSPDIPEGFTSRIQESGNRSVNTVPFVVNGQQKFRLTVDARSYVLREYDI